MWGLTPVMMMDGELAIPGRASAQSQLRLHGVSMRIMGQLVDHAALVQTKINDCFLDITVPSWYNLHADPIPPKARQPHVLHCMDLSVATALLTGSEQHLWMK